MTGTVAEGSVEVVGDVGQPERIVEDEPISWPEQEPVTTPVPVAPEPARSAG